MCWRATLCQMVLDVVLELCALDVVLCPNTYDLMSVHQGGQECAWPCQRNVLAPPLPLPVDT